ncbi:jg5705 [Pararge aegeria aegeria]|uniref:Jg5705 protein n=1 Tax=Pararge aegeria aegeria TaxID=348720 RepID=A0A8S4SDK9_9NEOP|nr:jg5705 [Pararge aegeria aegeria]
MGRAHSSEKGWTLGSQDAGMAAPYCIAKNLNGNWQGCQRLDKRVICCNWCRLMDEPDRFSLQIDNPKSAMEKFHIDFIIKGL